MCDNQYCPSNNVVEICGKTSDCCVFITRNYDGITREIDGYVPQDVGISNDSDYIAFQYCLDCGKIQGKFPIKEEAVDAVFEE